MANDFITPEEAAKRITEIIKKHSSKYQEESGCTNEEKWKLEHAIANSTLGGLSNPNQQGARD